MISLNDIGLLSRLLWADNVAAQWIDFLERRLLDGRKSFPQAGRGGAVVFSTGALLLLFFLFLNRFIESDPAC